MQNCFTCEHSTPNGECSIGQIENCPLEKEDGLETIAVYVRCPFCGNTSVVVVGKADFEKWENGACVQDAFPYLSADDRERLISGICPTCWDDMFNGMDEEEE